MFSAATKSARVATAANYIEDVFSTYLYTGNGSTQTITNGIDLAGKGGLVWLKGRSGSFGTADHALTDTARGVSSVLATNQTYAASAFSAELTSFGANGFTLGNAGLDNVSGSNYVSWTFRKQPKFFDVVTYTGNGNSSNQIISHNLQSIPGFIVVKRTDSTGNWYVWNQNNGTNQYLLLNTTDAIQNATNIWGTTTPDATTFRVGNNTTTNINGATYVAYLFANQAGGFGLTGTDNVISCGSYTGNGADPGPTVTLGYEPQWVMIKSSTATIGSNWMMVDTMRGFTMGVDETLMANSANAAVTTGSYINPIATGFQLAGANQPGNENWNKSGETYIYIAIRRGPMKTPTSGTSVFSPVAQTGTGATTTVTHGFPVDSWIASDRNNTSSLVTYKQAWFDRLLSNANGFITSSNAAWGGGWGNTYFKFDSNVGVPQTGNFTFLNNSGTPYVYWGLRRAPGFFDQVYYSGTGATQNVTHNLGVVPELMIVKRYNNVADWRVYAAPLGNTKYLAINTDQLAITDSGMWSSTTPTSSVFTVGTDVNATVNASGSTYSAYLFASCPGVSKVGSYTGTGATQTINCGFTGGARFVVIKRADVGNGSWYLYDTARGMVSGTDPSLYFNSTAAEVNANDVYTTSTGFQLVSSNAATNASGSTYIFLAIA